MGSAVIRIWRGQTHPILLDLAPVAWEGQGLFRIEYTADGETFRTHYLHGEPPFAWADYCKWIK